MLLCSTISSDNPLIAFNLCMALDGKFCDKVLVNLKTRVQALVEIWQTVRNLGPVIKNLKPMLTSVILSFKAVKMQTEVVVGELYFLINFRLIFC